jgi:hypothetical protein
VALKVVEGIDSVCPKNALDETEPSKGFFHPSLVDELDYLVEHAMAVIETDLCLGKQAVVRAVDLVDASFEEKSPIRLDYLKDFFGCHFLLAIGRFGIRLI